jgi:hypothetical protein
MIDDDEELAHELLLGTPGPKGREYPEFERERAARAALARLLRKEAAPNGFYTLRVADLIDPPTDPGNIQSDLVERKVIFQGRNRGTPVVVDERRRAKIAVFMRELEHCRHCIPFAPHGLPVKKQNRQRRGILQAVEVQFGVKRSTARKIENDYKESEKQKQKRFARKHPIK